jgi:hypothetical protein
VEKVIALETVKIRGYSPQEKQNSPKTGSTTNGEEKTGE